MAEEKVALAAGNHVPINVHSEYEIAYWVEKLRVTRNELRGAVAEVGLMVDDIEQYLRAQR